MKGVGLVVVALGCVAQASCGAEVAVPASAPLPSLGRAGGFMAPDERGDLAGVPDATGMPARATVLELWATSCEACRLSLPAVVAEAPGLARDGVGVVLVGVLDGGEPIGAARAALRSWGVERGFLVDRGGGVQRALGVDGLPGTIVLDGEGVVRWVAPAGARAGTVAAAARWVARRRTTEATR